MQSGGKKMEGEMSKEEGALTEIAIKIVDQRIIAYQKAWEKYTKNFLHSLLSRVPDARDFCLKTVNRDHELFVSKSGGYIHVGRAREVQLLLSEMYNHCADCTMLADAKPGIKISTPSGLCKWCQALKV